MGLFALDVARFLSRFFRVPVCFALPVFVGTFFLTPIFFFWVLLGQSVSRTQMLMVEINDPPRTKQKACSH